MPETATPTDPARHAGQLGRTRAAMRAAMVVERGWPLLLPLVVVIALFASLSWFGTFRFLPDIARLGLAAAFAVSALLALYPLRFYRRPLNGEIDRRIETTNELQHTPLLVQGDEPSASGDAFSQALWREHQRRMAASLSSVSSDRPRTRVPERDPFALRAAAALLLVAGFAFSFGPKGGSLGDAFHARAIEPAIAPRVDAWVTPPAYTGKAPLFLTAENNAANASVFTVPEGSDVTLRVTGGSGEEKLLLTSVDGNAEEIAPVGAAPKDGKVPTEAIPAPTAAKTGVLQFAGRLSADAVLTLKSGEATLNSWSFAVTPDQAPVIKFVGEPKRAANGSFELQYEILDDYGATSAKAEIVLAEPQKPDARPLYEKPEMPLSVPRANAQNKTMKVSRDLTEHVWSGSDIKLTLTAVDAAGQTATTEAKTVMLPEHPFTNPLARAVVDLRKILSLNANAKPGVLDLTDAITLRPEDTFENLSHYLGLMAGRTQLKLAQDDDALRGVADYFWKMALQIEDGDLSDAEKRLRQAQEALKQALQNNASDEEISKRMQELREAMNEFLREFAERAARDPNTAQQQPGQMQEMRKSDLEKMMDQIENLAKSGNKEQAEQLLSELQDMMNNLQAGRQQQGENGQQSEMRQQMDKLGEIMRRQQETMNDTFRMEQMQRGEQGEQGEGESQDGQQPGEDGQQPGQGMTPQEFADAMKQLQEGQGKLQSDLESLMKGLKGMGIEPGEGFGEAGKAMGEAEGALGDREGERAVGEQGRALEALRKGAQDMMKQMQQAQQGDEGGSEEGGRQQNSDRDPLGRPRATSGPDFGNSVKVPDEIDVQRARQILEAIRKRLGNALSPDLERSYLERLLELK